MVINWTARPRKEHSDFHELLTAATSMPAFFLDVLPQQLILDMCASPGSKISQLIEIIHGQQEGIVIANELDKKRAHIHLLINCSGIRVPM